MKIDLIKKEYLKKLRLLSHYNKKYYDESKPELSDADYDLFKKEIQKIEEKYSFLKTLDSPTIQVGFKPSKNFKKVSHKVPMLSLANAFSEQDLINFEKKNKKLFI